MKALTFLELSRFWVPTPTYLQAHGPVTAEKVSPGAAQTAQGSDPGGTRNALKHIA